MHASCSGGPLPAAQLAELFLLPLILASYSTVPYSTVPYSTVTPLCMPCCGPLPAAQLAELFLLPYTSIIQYSTLQYSTLQYSTLQYSTLQSVTPLCMPCCGPLPAAQLAELFLLPLILASSQWQSPAVHRVPYSTVPSQYQSPPSTVPYQLQCQHPVHCPAVAPYPAAQLAELFLSLSLARSFLPTCAPPSRQISSPARARTGSSG